jgi:hypothetical protein
LPLFVAERDVTDRAVLEQQPELVLADHRDSDDVDESG